MNDCQAIINNLLIIYTQYIGESKEDLKDFKM